MPRNQKKQIPRRIFRARCIAEGIGLYEQHVRSYEVPIFSIPAIERWLRTPGTIVTSINKTKNSATRIVRVKTLSQMQRSSMVRSFGLTHVWVGNGRVRELDLSRPDDRKLKFS